MGNLNYIVFGGVDSRDYGIYISGEGVFNAPERDVEVVNIPGKDGDLLIDRGRFLNIQVTYPGFNFEPDLSTFAERLRAFRAALASQIGYQRLEDSFHPDEFRMATFRSGLDINPVMYNTASTFDIVFDCKPQRFLKSGEEEITIGEWGETQTVSGSIATFEAESNTGIKSLVVDIDPVQSGSGDPSPSNVRPISGWDEVDINVTGVNIWDEEWEVGGIDPSSGTNVSYSTRIRSKNYIPLVSGMTYSFNYVGSSISNNGLVVVFYDSNKEYVQGSWRQSSFSPFTVPSNVKYMRFATGDGYGATYNNDISINYPATDTSYHIGTNNESYPIPLGQTVYGGVLDAVSGKLTLTKGYKALTSADNYSYNGTFVGVASQWVFTPNPPKANGVDNFFSNRFKTAVGDASLYNVNGRATNGNIYFNIPESIGSDVTLAKQWFANNPTQICYELATPIEVQLTPTEVKTLLGLNNIWADSGEVTVEFGADPSILVNPTPFEALPIFEVVGTGSLTVGNTTINITGDSAQDIFIDSDIMEAYEDDNGAIISRNDRISLSGMHFPTLGTETGITYTGLTSVTVTPRWWTI